MKNTPSKIKQHPGHLVVTIYGALGCVRVQVLSRTLPASEHGSTFTIATTR